MTARRIFTRRRWNWRPLLIGLTILAAVIFYAPAAFGETVRGVNKRGAFTCWYSQGPLLKFCVTLTNERR